MGTNWNIVCRECSHELFSEWRKRRPSTLAALCASGLLDSRPEPNRGLRDTDFELVLTDGMGEEINLDSIPRLCGASYLTGSSIHEYEPRNEYNEWAKPEYWPAWHPKARTVVVSAMCFTSSENGGATCRAG